jgi:hypothetical protein
MLRKKILENKKILFIAPIFYGYEKVISEQLKKEGASVIFYPEREDGISYKLVSNFRKNNLKQFQEKYYTNIFNEIKGTKIDYLFVIRGFLMPLSFIEKMKSCFPKALLIMHQWDSMRNNNYEKYIGQFDKFFSFDPIDCKNYPSLIYLPNFFLPDYADSVKRKIIYDLSFIGWAYEERIKIVNKITRQLKGKKIFVYSYLPLLTHIKNIFRGVLLKEAKILPIPLNDVLKVVQQSFCVLDIADSAQTGYTYRSIDAIAAGKKLITTNTYIKQEKFYNERNVMIIDRSNPQINLDFFETAFVKINIEDYSLDKWIKNIFEGNNKNYL